MRAALGVLGTVPRSAYRRRIAVLGDMLELGPDEKSHHLSIKDAIEAAGTDLVFACGPNMAHLFAALRPDMQGAWAERSDGLVEPLLAALAPGDALMIKGSNGSRMGPLAETLKKKIGSETLTGVTDLLSWLKCWLRGSGAVRAPIEGKGKTCCTSS